MKSLPDNQIEELARQVEAHADYKVLRRLIPQESFREPDGRPLAKGIILDTETTGLSDTDKIIELALVVFEYDPATGEAFRVLETYDALVGNHLVGDPGDLGDRGGKLGTRIFQRVVCFEHTECLAGCRVILKNHQGKFDDFVCIGETYTSEAETVFR